MNLNVIDRMYSPSCSDVDRIAAHKELETFKEHTLPLLQIEFAIQLITENKSTATYRHFGLQLMETCIKFKWNALNDDQRSWIMQKCIGLVTESLLDILVEERFVVDAVSRCLVELAKREWPQAWPTFIDECLAACNLGASQTEVVLSTILRMIEDVAILQICEPAHRRRELHTALVAVLPQILLLLKSVLLKLINVGNSSTDENKRSLKLCRTALAACAGIVEWSPPHAFDDTTVMQIVCQLICSSDKDISILAADCVAQFANKKFKPKDHLAAFHFFGADIITHLLSATKAASLDMQCVEKYSLLKKLSSIFAGVASAWATLDDISEVAPETFDLLLSALMLFLDLPSIALRFESVKCLHNFAKHSAFSKNAQLRGVAKQLIKRSVLIAQKIGLPSKSDSEICNFSRCDFDNDVEFVIEFSRLRQYVFELLRHLAVTESAFIFETASLWLLRLLRNYTNATLVEWEALSKYLDFVVPRLFQITALSETKEFHDRGNECVGAVISLFSNLKEPEALSYLLTCLSALSLFLPEFTQAIPGIIDLLFRLSSLKIDKSCTTAEQDALHSLRSHAPLVLMKLTATLPDVLLPFFDVILSVISERSNFLTLRQICTYAEALSILSNAFGSYEKQAAFAETILRDTKSYFQSGEVTEALKTPDNFIHFIGLTFAPNDDIDTCPFVNRRKTLMAHIVLIQNLVKRISIPSDVNKASEGGYMTSDESGLLVSRHPVFPAVSPLLPYVFSLSRCLNGLYLGSVMAQIHTGFGVRVLDISIANKCVITGLLPPADGEKLFPRVTAVDFVQSYIWEISEHVMISMAYCFSQFQHQFFSLPEASLLLREGTLGYVEHSTDYRIRSLLRFTLKSLFCILPTPKFHSVVRDSIGHFIAHVYQRLSSRWDNISKRLDSNALELPTVDLQAADGLTDDADVSQQEIFAEEMTRLLTREHVEFVSGIVRGAAQSSVSCSVTASTQSTASNELMDDFCENEVTNGLDEAFAASQNCSAANVGLLAQSLLTDQLTSKSLLDSESACHVFSCILGGLHFHGEHDNAISPLLLLAVSAYELLRPIFPAIQDQLTQLPDCRPELLQHFEQSAVFCDISKRPPEKARKEQFKKLVKSIIGRNIGQQYKKTIQMRQLPPLFIQKSSKLVHAVEDAEASICSLFGTS